MSGAEESAPAVRRARIELLEGPWWDGEPCVRFVDFVESQNLYDLHEGILSAVAFEGEYPFYFYRAPAPEGPREMVPAEMPQRPIAEEMDDDPYENENAWGALGAGRADALPLFYVFMGAGGEWLFRVTVSADAVPRVPDAFYPETVESLSIGPAPTQFGYDLDDFAEDEESLLPFSERRADELPGDSDEDFGDDEDEEG